MLEYSNYTKPNRISHPRMSSIVFISFRCLLCCIHVRSCSFHFAIIPCHVAFISFHSALAIFHYLFCYRFDVVSEACAGCHVRLYELLLTQVRYLFSSYRFLGQQRIGSGKVQAKLRCNARVYDTIPIASNQREATTEQVEQYFEPKSCIITLRVIAVDGSSL